MKPRAQIGDQREDIRPPFHLAAYTDASTFGGAEQCLATVLAGLETDARITVVGTSASVVEPLG